MSDVIDQEERMAWWHEAKFESAPYVLPFSDEKWLDGVYEG